MTAGGPGSATSALKIDPLPISGGEPAPCFVAGTLIQTAHGNVAIEEMKAGDMVLTADNGRQAVKWIGSTTVRLSSDQINRPITFAAGSILGNKEDVQFSPNHRVQLRGIFTDILFGETDVLVMAITLVNDKDVTIDFTSKTVQYFHMMFENHEVVFCADGTASESLFVGAQSIKGFGRETREEILTFFPELGYGQSSPMRAAAPVLTPHESKVLSSTM